jgi:hypothetical protein
MGVQDVTLQRMQAIMRLNDWQHDPLSGGDPGEQLSGRPTLASPVTTVPAHVTSHSLLLRPARYDLDATDAWCGGAIDAKITSHALRAVNLSTSAISGSMQRIPHIRGSKR